MVNRSKTIIAKQKREEKVPVDSAAEGNEETRAREWQIETHSLQMSHCSTACLVSTWFSTYSWIVSTPHSVLVYTSCT